MNSSNGLFSLIEALSKPSDDRAAAPSTDKSNPFESHEKIYELNTPFSIPIKRTVEDDDIQIIKITPVPKTEKTDQDLLPTVNTPLSTPKIENVHVNHELTKTDLKFNTDIASNYRENLQLLSKIQPAKPRETTKPSEQPKPPAPQKSHNVPPLKLSQAEKEAVKNRITSMLKITDREKQHQILGCRKYEQGLYFAVQMPNGEIHWISNDEMKEKHLGILFKYYEDHLEL